MDNPDVIPLLPTQPSGDPVRRSNARVLVLDDEPFMLTLLGHMLERLGYDQVTCHDNGAAALAWMDEGDAAPDLILLDINMPGMDGVQFVRHLSQRGYAGGLILVSGEDELLLQSTEKLARAHNLSTTVPLRKPPRTESLAAALGQWSDPPARRRSGERKTYDSAAVRQAIEQGQLVNYYQPKVLVTSGELIGVEALVRWQHPTDGLVFPDQFIPVAESAGLIHELTRQVFRAALAQTRDWLAVGLSLRVAVNVSMDDLTTMQLADFVIAETAASGVPPQLVQLEITESRLMSKLTHVLDELIRLRLKRFRLSIDDFGSGHSSLVQLRDLPFDELKIDRSFTHNAAHDPRVRAIFEGSLGIGKLLGMEIVAEGVEDGDDWGFLARSGCHIAQGYFIGRPMPGGQLVNWLQEWKARVWQDHLVTRPAGL